MNQQKNILLVVLVMMLLFVSPARAALSDQQRQRVQAYRALVADVDDKPLAEALAELTASDDPEGNLILEEGVAAAYRDIVQAQEIVEPHRRQRLYSLVRLNMAYFQLGGDPNTRTGDSINRLIQRKLVENLPQDIWSRPGLFHSLE